MSHTDVHNKAARLIASVMGALGGLGAMVHGVGEVLQGDTTASSIFIQSWAQGPIATYMDGDPAITLISNMLISGCLVLIFSFVTIIYAGVYIRYNRDGLVLIFLAIIMLLVGGGVGPPVLTLLAGLAGLGINAAYAWWRSHVSGHILAILAAAWPWIFAVCVLNGIFLLVGHVIAAYFFAPVASNIFLNSFFFGVLTIIASIISGIAYDISRAAVAAPL